MSKRQGDLLNFFNTKKIKTEEHIKYNEPVQNEESMSSNGTQDFQCHKTLESLNCEPNLPDCWTEKQLISYKETYKWLDIKSGKLGCKNCSKVKNLGVSAEKHVHISQEWCNYLITPNGKNKISRQASLRKKIREHSMSNAHNVMQNLLKQSEQNVIQNLIYQINEKEIETTSRIFNTVYSLIKQNRPLTDIDKALELQKKKRC